jgi:hypothetical protein
MAILKWERPSGSTAETNDLPATIDAAVKLGWKPAKPAPAKKKPAKK